MATLDGSSGINGRRIRTTGGGWWILGGDGQTAASERSSRPSSHSSWFSLRFRRLAEVGQARAAGKVAVAFLAPSPPFILMGFRVPATLSPIGLAIRDWGLGPAQLSLAWSDFMTTEGVY